MKQAIHPDYGLVVFRDRSADATFLMRSTIVGRLAADHPRIEWQDGESYPLVDVDVTSASHPFWTGRGRVVDSEGRVEKFNRRFRRYGPVAVGQGRSAEGGPAPDRLGLDRPPLDRPDGQNLPAGQGSER